MKSLKHSVLFLILISFTVLQSCKKDDDNDNMTTETSRTDALVGKWILTNLSGTIKEVNTNGTDTVSYYEQISNYDGDTIMTTETTVDSNGKMVVPLKGTIDFSIEIKSDGSMKYSELFDASPIVTRESSGEGYWAWMYSGSKESAIKFNLTYGYDPKYIIPGQTYKVEKLDDNQLIFNLIGYEEVKVTFLGTPTVKHNEYNLRYVFSPEGMVQ